MKVELKDVKVHEDMSDETTCFSATILIDGEEAADVKNHGQGGPDELYFKNRNLEKRFYEFVSSLPALPAKLVKSAEFGDWMSPEMEMDAEIYVATLLEKHAKEG